MYNLKADADCVKNLANSDDHQQLKQRLQDQLFKALKAQADPRMLGNSDYFDKIPYVNAGTRNFYERYMRGEKVRAGWVNPSDFAKEPLD